MVERTFSSLNSERSISAIVVAIMMITKYCKKLKYRRKIVLVTDGRGSLDADDSSEIVKKIIADGMELVVVYVTKNLMPNHLLKPTKWCRL